ncbi:AAA family ATPase [Streptomyces sp. NPDC096012]|uniref:helix-turn-helix transcriptional regulator n=1 Tax=Streptomyces sp. NPDC096012 TaxID=3155684 RepID=UPI00336A0E73
MLSRDCEASDLQRVLASAASGAGASLLLEGGIGTGKSYLLRAAVRTARAGGFETTSIRARPSGTALTYDVLRQLRSCPPAGPAPDCGTAGPPAADPGSPEAAADRLDQLIGALTPRTPLLIAVDDLHWADRRSLCWLEHLMARLEGLPVALLATIVPGLAPSREDPAGGPGTGVGDGGAGGCGRGTDDGTPYGGGAGRGGEAGGFGGERVATGHGETAARVPGARGAGTAALARVVSDFHQRTVLSGLDPDAVGYLLTSFFGRPVADAVVRACHRVTGGNPLLIHALLRELRRCGTATEPTCEQIDSLGSVEVAETVVARFEERFPGVGRALDSVAVTGRAGTPALVAELVGIPQTEAADMLHTLVRCGVLQEAGEGVAFAQPMMPVSFLAALPPSEHARLHAAAARALHASGAPAHEVVHHLRHAPPIGERWAYRLLFDAACTALSRHDMDEARSLLERCAREGGPGDQPELLRRLSCVELAADAPAAAVSRLRALARPRHAGDDAAIATLVNLVQATALDGDLDAARHIVRGTLVDLEPLDPAPEPAAGAFAVLGVLTLLTGGGRTPLPVPAAPGTARIPWVRCAQATLAALAARSHGGRREEAVRHARAGLSEPAGPADVPTTPLRLLLAELLCDAGEHEEALDACRALAAAARADGARTMAALAEAGLATCGHQAGRLREAAQAARRALTDGPAGTWLGSALARSRLGGILLDTGDLDGARGLLLDDLALTELPEAALPELLFHRGRLHAVLGRTQAGLADLEKCGRQLREAHHPDRHPWRAAAAALYAHEGDTAAAERLAGEELEQARAWGAPHAVATALHTLALVTRGGQRAPLLYEAADLLRDTGAWLQQARVLRSLGHELRRLRKARQAREQLRAALALAERCGAGALVDALRDDLASAGARPRRGAETGLDALTPAEHRTALLAAEGLTNKEIADRLYVTRRTVELHLSRVYRKLSVSGRTDLPAAVADQLPDPGRRTALRRVDGALSPPGRTTRSMTLRPAS